MKPPKVTNGKVTLTVAEYNKLVLRLRNARSLALQAEKIFVLIQRTAGNGSDLINAGLKGVGEPTPPNDLNDPPLADQP